MSQRYTRGSTVIGKAPIPAVAPRLTAEQLACLQRCARGISLRFDEPSDVHALVVAGYAKQGIARVVTITAEGLRYLQTRANRFDELERSVDDQEVVLA